MTIPHLHDRTSYIRAFHPDEVTDPTTLQVMDGISIAEFPGEWFLIKDQFFQSNGDTLVQVLFTNDSKFLFILSGNVYGGHLICLDDESKTPIMLNQNKICPPCLYFSDDKTLRTDKNMKIALPYSLQVTELQSQTSKLQTSSWQCEDLYCESMTCPKISIGKSILHEGSISNVSSLTIAGNTGVTCNAESLIIVGDISRLQNNHIDRLSAVTCSGFIQSHSFVKNSFFYWSNASLNVYVPTCSVSQTVTTASITDGTATWNGTSFQNVTNMTASGTVSVGNTLTDSVASLSSNAMTGLFTTEVKSQLLTNTLSVSPTTSMSTGELTGLSSCISSQSMSVNNGQIGSYTIPNTGHLTGLSTLENTGTLTVTSVTDGVATFNNGQWTGVVNWSDDATFTANALTDGTATLSGSTFNGLHSISGLVVDVSNTYTDGTTSLTSTLWSNVQNIQVLGRSSWATSITIGGGNSTLNVLNSEVKVTELTATGSVLCDTWNTSGVTCTNGTIQGVASLSVTSNLSASAITDGTSTLYANGTFTGLSDVSLSGNVVTGAFSDGIATYNGSTWSGLFGLVATGGITCSRFEHESLCSMENGVGTFQMVHAKGLAYGGELPSSEPYALMLEHRNNEYFHFLTPDDKQSGFYFNQSSILSHNPSHATLPNIWTWLVDGTALNTTGFILNYYGEMLFRGNGTALYDTSIGQSCIFRFNNETQGTLENSHGLTIHNVHASAEIAGVVLQTGSVNSAICARTTTPNVDADLDFWVNNNVKMTLTGAGNLGILTSSPSSKLTVSGDAYISGACNVSSIQTGARMFLSSTMGVGTQANVVSPFIANVQDSISLKLNSAQDVSGAPAIGVSGDIGIYDNSGDIAMGFFSQDDNFDTAKIGWNVYRNGAFEYASKDGYCFKMGPNSSGAFELQCSSVKTADEKVDAWNNCFSFDPETGKFTFSSNMNVIIAGVTAFDYGHEDNYSKFIENGTTISFHYKNGDYPAPTSQYDLPDVEPGTIRWGWNSGFTFFLKTRTLGWLVKGYD